MFIEWNDNLKTGIPIIDEQHQELIVMLNRLGRFREGRNSFNKALTDLQDYINIHFRTEEEYMISTKYPDYDKHKASHEQLICELKKHLNDIDKVENIYELGLKLCALVGNWIIDHYSDEDVKLVNYIKSRH